MDQPKCLGSKDCLLLFHMNMLWCVIRCRQSNTSLTIGERPWSGSALLRSINSAAASGSAVEPRVTRSASAGVW